MSVVSIDALRADRLLESFIDHYVACHDCPGAFLTDLATSVDLIDAMCGEGRRRWGSWLLALAEVA